MAPPTERQGAAPLPRLTSIASRLWGFLALAAVLPALAVWYVGSADLPRRGAVLPSSSVHVPSYARTFDSERALANASPRGLQDADPLETRSDAASLTPLPRGKAPTLAPLSARERTVALLTPPTGASGATSIDSGPVGVLIRDTPEMRLAILVYVAVLALAAVLVLSVARSLRQFDRIAADLAYGRAIDSPSTTLLGVRELRGALTALDRLVVDLRRASERSRQAAEDSAHAMRTPLGTIMGSLDAIRRGLPPDNKRAWRAVEFIDASASRLAGLISEARCRQVENACQVAAPRLRVDVSELVAQATRPLRKAAFARNVRLVEHLEQGIFVRASVDALERLVDEMLDEACLALPSVRTVIVSFAADRETVRLEVDVERAGDIEGSGLEEWPDASAILHTVEALGSRVVACPHSPAASLVVELPRD